MRKQLKAWITYFSGSCFYYDKKPSGNLVAKEKLKTKLYWRPANFRPDDGKAASGFYRRNFLSKIKLWKAFGAICNAISEKRKVKKADRDPDKPGFQMKYFPIFRLILKVYNVR